MSDLRRDLSAVLEQAMKITKADFGNIQVVETRGHTLRIVVHWGFEKPFLEFFRVVKHDLSACAEAMKRGECVVVRDVKRSRLYTEPARRAMLAAGVRAVQSTPVLDPEHGGDVIAMISTHFRKPHVPTRAQLARVGRLAAHAAALVQPGAAERLRLDARRAIEEIHDGASSKTRVVRGAASL